jgi:N-hydroxyarylamine O-acetyltransferase
MDDQARAAYLARLGLGGASLDRAAADEAGLRELHRAHQLAVPFENLSIHLQEEISLAEDDLLAKLTTRGRGGFCYELNGAFALLLEALGARVERVAARVYGDNGLGPPFDHLALIVTGADGSGPWLADVGFGMHSVYPLRFGERGPQDDPGGRFLLADSARGDVEVIKDDKPQYLIERRERELAEFEPTCWWQQTSPKSHFRAGTVCSRLTEDGRVTISGRLLITTSAGVRAEAELSDDADLLAAYRDHFGIALDRVPARQEPDRTGLD